MTAIELDVSAALGEPAHLSGSFYPALSQPTPTQKPLLVCLPGGTYNRDYFDLPIPGYSFAQHMIDRGYGLVTFDQLGTGGSTRPTREIGLADQASAMASAVGQLPEVTGHSGPFIGIGHSMGGYVAMLQQHHDRTYLALAILGTTNQWVEPLGLPPEMLEAAATRAGRDALVEQMASAMPERLVEADRTPLLSWFHLSDVPSAVIAEDIRTTSKGSGHCHNMASTRHLLWDRLAAWFDDCE